MTNKASSFPAAPQIEPLHRHGGRIAALGQLPIHALGDDYTVDGSGTVLSLPTLPAGVTVYLSITGAPTFVNSTKLICPNGVNYFAAAGDLVIARSSGNGAWQLYVLASAPNAGTSQQGRLTLTSGVPVTESDVTGATTIYFTPSGGNRVAIYDGALWRYPAFSELSLALDSTAAHTGYQQSANIFDLWVVNDAGTIRLGTGPSWAAGAVAGSLLARGTGAGSSELENFQGMPVNKNSMTLRFGSASGNTISVPARQASYVGSFYATADGQATDSKLKRLLFNAYNATDRLMYMTAPANHTWSTNTFQPLANDPTNCFNILLGLSGTKVSAAAVNTAGNSTATIQTVANAIGLDSTTSGTTGGLSKWCSISNAAFAPVECYYDGYPGIGFHSLYWLERGAGADTQTWFQTNSAMKGSVVS